MRGRGVVRKTAYLVDPDVEELRVPVDGKRRAQFELVSATLLAPPSRVRS